MTTLARTPMKLFILFVCVAATQSASVSICKIYNNSDCTDGYDLLTVYADNAEACLAACVATSGCCVGMWVSQPPVGGGESNRCHLKYDGKLISTGTKPGGVAFNCTPGSSPDGADHHCRHLSPPAPTPPNPPTPAPPVKVPPCSLNGEISDGKCVCDIGWIGENCGQLDLLPAPPLAKQVTPLAATTWNNTAANSTWGISVIGPDKYGTYHGYMTEIANHCPLGDYGEASQIVHMTATNPAGPWARKGVALKGFAHNPQAVVAPNGSIFLFHIGSEMKPGCLKNCSNNPPPPPPNCTGMDHASSVAVAESYEGPWRRYSYIIQHAGHPTNPTAFIFPNGTIFLGTRRYSFDHYPAWIGHVSSPQGPWVPYESKVWSTVAGSIKVGEEDSFIWKSDRGFHQITHRGIPRSSQGWPMAPSTGCGGGHLYSPDLRSWFFGENVFGRNASADAQCVMHYSDGPGGAEVGMIRLTSRQRPTIYFGKNGNRYLYTGASGPTPEMTEYKHSFTLVQQINTKKSTRNIVYMPSHQI